MAIAIHRNGLARTSIGMTTPGRFTISLVIAITLGLLWVPTAQAQRRKSRGQPSPEQIEKMKAAQAASQAAQSAAGQANKQKAEEKKEGKPNGDKKKGEGSSASKQATVKRPEKPEGEVDREELKVRPDEQGFVQFSFNGQPWKEVLQWYADVADKNFNWQELPSGFLNLTTKRKYRLDETRDLFNRHLLERGFTILISGESMLVVKVKDLDPSLIPRVDADELEDYQPHDLVRVRFQLPKNLEPEQAAKDVKILTSSNAKIQPLLATKRLHVIDTVINLRSVRDLIYSEQAAITEDIRPREFMIRERRADYIADQVMIVLGLDPASRKSPQELQLEQQRMQLYTQMMQKGKDISKMVSKNGPKVFIAVNQQQNSILVNAAEAELLVIERTIKMLDVAPNGGEVARADGLEFKKYQTATASTDSIITALKEIGLLHPLTQLQSDKKNRVIYATATAADHEKIQRMIDRLDGTGRTGHVIWLSRGAPADQVAGTIGALMVGEKKEKSSSRRRYSYFGYYGSNDEEEKDTGEMRIQPDLENNRLLLWATEAEYDEVVTLLNEIGAIANPERGNPSKVRVLDARSPEETAALLERLQKSWSGKNRIEIHGSPQVEPKPKQPKKAESEEQKQDKLTRSANRIPARFVQSRSHSTAEAEAEVDSAAAGASPIRITVTPDGRLVVTSDDPAALDQLETLVEELEPPVQDFKLYSLENSRVSLVVINLKDYFKDELADQKETVYDYWGDYAGKRDKKTGPSTLGRRRQLRFIWDIDTNTIIAQNASPSQIAAIDRLIEIYDRPVAADSVAARRTEAIEIKHGNAQDIATSIKEVFRDLLSSKDKEFQGKEGQGKSRTETHYRFYRGGQDEDSNKKLAPVKMAFEGALSIGVDEISNTLIISAQEQVFDTVVDIAWQLDDRARPQTIVQVHQVRGAISPEKMQQALAKAIGRPWQGSKPPSATGGKAKKGEDKGKGESKEKK